MMRALCMVTIAALCACDRPTSTSNAPPSTTPAPVASPPAPPAVSAAADAGTGSLSARFEPVVGDWLEAQAVGVNGFEVDGSKWRDGTPSSNLADQAKRLYGDRYAEFLDGVKAFAFYPLAIYKEPPPAGDLRVSVRFYPMAGTIDQAAGIAFGITPSGSYHGVRANALEDNLLYFTVTKGKRSVIDTVRNVPTATRAWHTLALELRGKQLTVRLDDAKRFEKTLDTAPVGRIGLWSKADSKVLFDGFAIEKL
jgi:hypothetical protein